MSWGERIDWTTPAGQTLRSLIALLPDTRVWSITVFGSAPLQLALESGFLSADVDLFTDDETRDELAAILERSGLGNHEREIYVQQCVEWNFRTSPRWRARAFTAKIDHVRLTLPAPIDLLIAKLHRLEEKDLAAFRLAIARTGHPVEAELRRELQAAVDLYRPNFDEEAIGDITTNTRVLWRELWGKNIDVRREIIAPALEARRQGYAPDLPRRDYKADLRALGEES
ncbi:MAG: hypothetical protein ABI680_02875 [Chthoniobacteraceae bacterium]